MCGRYGLTAFPWQFARKLGVRSPERPLPARYNIAPTQPVLAVTNAGERDLDELRWGLVPPHAEHPSAVRLSLFNARVEAIATSPIYRAAFGARRCAIFADGFFEWRKDADGGKTPMWIHRVDGEGFVFAGIWERWEPPEGGDPLTTCSIVTQPANAFMATIHPRMPVVLGAARADAWLAPGERPASELLDLLEPSPADDWTAHPVAPRVGNARFDDPRLIEPVPDQAATAPSLFD